MRFLESKAPTESYGADLADPPRDNNVVRLLELGFILPGIALSLGTGVLGFGALLFLKEGVGRLLDFRKAGEVLEAGGTPLLEEASIDPGI
jgi:hypothetical protein